MVISATQGRPFDRMVDSAQVGAQQQSGEENKIPVMIGKRTDSRAKDSGSL